MAKDDFKIDLDNIIYEEDSIDDFDEFEPEKIDVKAPSGAIYPVLGEREKEFYEETVFRYTSDNKFTNVSDLQDLDRVILFELLSFRWGQYLLNKTDYYGQPIDEEEIRRAINDLSKENRLLKKSLSMDKASRDKDRGESITDYIENLKIRAREFGYVRNQQAVMAITLWKELEGKIQLNENADEQEKRELSASFEDIVEWLCVEAFPKFNAIDEEFRKTSQRYWIREL